MTVTFQKSIEIDLEKLDSIAYYVNEYLFESVGDYLEEYNEEENAELTDMIADIVKKKLIKSWNM